jgi:beta-glucosidase
MKIRAWAAAAVIAMPALTAAVVVAAPRKGPAPVAVASRVKPVITVGGLRFRDLDGNGRLTPYEDWRLSPEARAADLLGRMTLAEKVGEMVHGTLPGKGGALGRSADGYDMAAVKPLVAERFITHFITRLSLAPGVMAAQANQVQEMAEAGRLGIPVTISSDPRNHFHHVLGAAETAAGVSQWPDLMGFAALRDPALVSRFAVIARTEYRAVGIHEALSPQLDLASEPRWSRIGGTMGADPALISRLGNAYVIGFQGGPTGLAPNGVMAVAKHWVGYGALPQGFDGHNYYGRFARMNSQQLQLHIAAFKGAFAAHVGAVMPTYPIVAGPVIDGKPVEPVGAGYSRVLLTDLLRGKLGYRGILLSDWGITEDCNSRCRAPTAQEPQRSQDVSTAWGVEDLPVPQRFARGIAAGLDQFGGTHDTAALLEAVRTGLVGEARIDQSVRRLLAVKFRLGLFENPYVDPAAAIRIIANPAHQAEGARLQREAQVLLTNKGIIPVGSGSRPAGRKVWLFGADPAAARAAGLTVVDRPEQADFALIRAESPSELLHPYSFFGTRQKEGRLDYRDGDPAYDALKQAKAAGIPAVFSVFLDRPAVLARVVDKADAIIANFGASDAAVLDVVLGRARARGRLPFELPSSMAAVEAQDPAVPDDSANPLFRRGAGIVPRARR